MRFRTGAILGFAAGYYLGARAGRERYEQLRKVLEAVPFGLAVEKLQAVVELAVERVRGEHSPPQA
jgi:hypothetical protein